MFTGSVSFLVIGSDFKTDRAAARLAEIGISIPGDALTLRRERGKIGRRPAVGVYTSRGRQIGYIQPHEVDLILSDLDHARAIFQSREPFGAVARITLDESRPALRIPKPKPTLRPPPPEPRDEFCDIFPNTMSTKADLSGHSVSFRQNAGPRRGPCVNKRETYWNGC